MKAMILTIILLVTGNLFACDELFKNYPFECKMQDQYLNIKSEFGRISLNYELIKGQIIPRAVSKQQYFENKNSLLHSNLKMLSLNPNWNNYKNSSEFIKQLNPVYLTIKDIQKLFLTIFDIGPLSPLSKDGGLRINSPETNPKETFNCDSPLRLSELDLVAEYDLKTSEGESLLSKNNINVCSNLNYYSGEIVFLKGASTKQELNRWIVDYNDMMTRYEYNNESYEISPYQYLSNMRRWFLAIRPFTKGNIEIINALMDYSTNRLKLPKIPLGFLDNPVLKTEEISLKNIQSEFEQNVKFLKGCLYEHQVAPISNECLSIN